MHSYLGHEGIAPVEFAAIARAEVRSYGVEVLDGRALDITRTDGDGGTGFSVELVGGHTITARRVLAAHSRTPRTRGPRDARLPGWQSY